MDDFKFRTRPRHERRYMFAFAAVLGVFIGYYTFNDILKERAMMLNNNSSNNSSNNNSNSGNSSGNSNGSI